ncbi:methyltransferase domain-containing protein [Candidatus Woesearchaeota archaeon]|nr:methyltransferase domain-containing protein [Candidatus Woesearchaeota archaeon]
MHAALKNRIRKTYSRPQSTFKRFTPLDNPFTDQIKKNLNKGSAVLDVGCGSGRLAVSIHKHAKKIVGVDFSRTLLKSAIRKPNIMYKLMDGERLKFPKESFDMIVSHAALNKHMCRAEPMLKSAFPILKPGGKLLLKMIYRTWGREFGFTGGYTVSEIRNALRAAGYSRINVSVNRKTIRTNDINDIKWLRSTEAADVGALENFLAKGPYAFDDSFMTVYAEKPVRP